MNKRLIILLLLVIPLIGCVQEKFETESKIETVKDCQCHTEVWEYKDHLNGLKHCLECHKIEEHSNVSWVKGYSGIEDCSQCHETMLLRIHMPKTSCVDCHGDAKTIHKKFEKELYSFSETKW